MRILRSIALAAALLPSLVAAQTQLPTLPANTVLGRLGVNAGPAQAIPFSQLGPTLITSNLQVSAPLTISGLVLQITGSAGKVLAGSTPAFTATPQLGVASTTSGTLAFANSANSGIVTVGAPSTSTSWTFKFPTTAGSNGQALTTDGSGNTSWSAGAGTVNSGTAGQLAYYATTAAAISGNTNLNISSGALTLGQSGSVVGSACFVNATSGSVCLQPTTGALSTAVATLPAGTYNVVGDTLTQTLTNKTLTSPTLNSPTMTTPTLGAATATTINKVTITAPATGSTLTIADGKTLTDTSGIGASILLGATGGGFSAYAGTSCTNQFPRSLSAAGAATCTSVANTDLTNSSLTIGSTSVSLGGTASTVAGLTLTAPTINGGTAQALTNFGVRSTGSGAFDMVLANTENLTAQRTLTTTLNNANRALNLSGDLTTAAAFTTAGANALTLTTTGATNVTLPTTGTLAVQNASNTFSATNTFSAANTFSALNQFTDLKFSSGKLYPTADSTSAMQFCKADGTTCYGTLDTTNQAATWATLKFTTLDSGSLGTSTSTITGLTVNNSPNASNDYLLYYSAADGRIRKATVGAIASGATAGVSSLNGLTGGLSIVAGSGVSVSAASTSVTLAAASAIPQGRLTLSTGVPVMTSTVSGATTVYYTPYNGTSIPIYDGTNMVLTTFSEVSQATTDATKSPAAVAASKCYDEFAWNDSGTFRVTRGPAWTNCSTRGYTLTMTNGVLLNTSSITNGPGALRGTWVGTIASNGSSTIDYIFGASASGGTAAVLNVWNTYNRRPTPTTVTDSGTTYTYATSTIRQARASAGNQISFIVGAKEDGIIGSYNCGFITAAGGVPACGLGMDSTTTFYCQPVGFQIATALSEAGGSTCHFDAQAAGTHTISANETSIVGTNSYNDNSFGNRNSFQATLWN